MKKKLKKIFSLLIVVMLFQILLPTMVQAETYNGFYQVTLGGTSTINGSTFEYTHGDVTITKNGVSVNTNSFEVDQGDEIVITFLPDAGYKAKLYNAFNGSNIVLDGNTYSFTIGTEAAATLTLTPSFELIPVTAHDITKIESNGTFALNKASADSGETITISSITPSTGYQLKEVKILNASNDEDITASVSYNSTNKTFTMPDYAVKVNVIFEKIPYTITITGDNVTISPTSPIGVEYGDNKTITITANGGYRLTSVKVDNVEQTLPLTSNNITLTNITKDMAIAVEVEEITYNFDNSSKDMTYTVGTDTDLLLTIEDTTITNLDKVYINNELLNEEFFELGTTDVTIKLKDSFLKTLKNGTYNLKITTKDNGEITTSFVIANSQVGLEKNPKTGDGIITSILLGSISIIGILGCTLFLNKKKKYN